ncbi:helix-turn-helix domain-containing protein [Aerococcus urinaeequi]|uniref:helix-turn-helix domain-containing protein n=1 Tax=Aerococcus urinaeequi TaxID=51665 RepID=UPI003D6A3694
MLQNRLAVIMAERGIKAINISKKTGIAASTLSKISNNQTTKIDYETIDAICIAVGITPQEFFEYYPFKFKFQVAKTDFNLSYQTNEFYDSVKLDSLTFKFDMVIEITGEKENDIDTSCLLEQNKFNGEYEVVVDVDREEEKNILKKILTDMPFSFRREFNRLAFDSIDKEFKNSYEEWKVNANMNIDAIEYELDSIINNLDYFMTVPMI